MIANGFKEGATVWEACGQRAPEMRRQPHTVTSQNHRTGRIIQQRQNYQKLQKQLEEPPA